jgi:ribosomal protein S18 acetylase RimI-like enzyme
LLRYAEAYAAEHHIPELRLYTNSAMTENLTLYRRLGYREDDRRTENGLNRVFLSKPLGPPSPFETASEKAK